MLDQCSREAITSALATIGVQLQSIAKLISQDETIEQPELALTEQEVLPVAVRFTDGAIITYGSLEEASRRLCGTSGHVDRKYLKPYLNDRLPEGSSKIKSITITRKGGRIVEL